MIWSVLMRLCPALSQLVSETRKVQFLLSKYDRDRPIHHATGELTDYDNTCVYVRGHESLPENVSCLVEELTNSDFVGTQAGKNLTKHPAVKLSLHDVDNEQFEIRYFYKELTFKFESLTEAYNFIQSRRAVRILAERKRYEAHLLAHGRFPDRMSVLRTIVQLSENLHVDRLDTLSVSAVPLTISQIKDALFDEYDQSMWPTQFHYKFEMVLGSLKESGDVKDGGGSSKVDVTPKAFATLAEEDIRQTSSNEAREQHRQLTVLRWAAIGLAFVGLIPTVIYPFFSWLQKIFV